MQLIKKIKSNLHLLFVITRIQRQLKERGLDDAAIELFWADTAYLCDDVGSLNVENLIDTANRLKNTFVVNSH